MEVWKELGKGHEKRQAPRKNKQTEKRIFEKKKKEDEEEGLDALTMKKERLRQRQKKSVFIDAFRPANRPKTLLCTKRLLQLFGLLSVEYFDH